MKLYKVSNAPIGQRWQSQKAQAAKLGEVEELELPRTGRQGTADFLNTNEQEVAGSASPLDELEQAELRAVREATTVSANQQREWEATDIQDFLLNRASVAQVENIFSALGTRFKEQARAS